MNFIFPFRKKCANVVNEIFCFLFSIYVYYQIHVVISQFLLLQEQTIYNM